jgi:DNA processing protein
MQPILHLTPETTPQFFQWQNDILPIVKNLYAIGNPDLLNTSPKLGIVGSRVISPYGIQILKTIIPTLVKNNVTIVSGGAFGVDYNAQKIALACNGKVITVLGSGIENPSPKSNSDFFQQVMQQGLLLSEEPGHTPGAKYSFVKRNRIIAGLCDCLLVIEARHKSGALITADYALEQNKTICAFPGKVYDYLSKGSNQLIKDGAVLADCAEDILYHLQN